MNKADFREKLKMVPGKPGVYLFKNEHSDVLYVGKARILRNRIQSYFRESRPANPRIQNLVRNIYDFDFIVTDSDIEALILEANLIKKHKPRYNINLKDDKSYPYIRITNEDFPQIYATRKIIKDGSKYFGPYTNVKDMRSALNIIKKIFTIRSCKYNLDQNTIESRKVQLCLDYYIQKCKGPCQALQSKPDYAKMINHVEKFLTGKTSEILNELKKEMDEKAINQEFEEAARIRDKIEALELYRNNQKIITQDIDDRDICALAREDEDACAVVFKIREGKIIGRIHYYIKDVLNASYDEILTQFLNQYYNQSHEIPKEIFLPVKIKDHTLLVKWLESRTGHNIKIFVPQKGEKKKLIDMCTKNARYLLDELKIQKLKSKEKTPLILRALQRDLSLKNPPRIIECFDISNLQGTDPVASMVRFVDGKPKKSEYRKFKINVKDTPDDFAMMHEVVYRRYRRLKQEKNEMPGLIVIDGGKGQLTSALKALNDLKITNQPVIGLAKRLEEIYVPESQAPQSLPKTSSSLKVLKQIRDEAHRFAITFHRNRRKKRTIASELDLIPGVGEKRRNNLLKLFGSVDALKKEDINSIKEKAGIPEKVAKLIIEHLNKK